MDRLCPQRHPELGPGLSSGLPGQGPVAGGGGDGAPPPSREGRQRSAAQAAGGAPGGGPLRGLGGHLGRPLGRRLREAPALGCREDAGHQVLLEVLEGKGFVHQAQGVAGGRLPGREASVALLQPRPRALRGQPRQRRGGRGRPLAPGGQSGWRRVGVAPPRCLEPKTHVFVLATVSGPPAKACKTGKSGTLRRQISA